MACYNPHTNTVGQYNPLHTLNHQDQSAMDAVGYIKKSTTSYHFLKENLHLLDVPGS